MRITCKAHIDHSRSSIYIYVYLLVPLFSQRTEYWKELEIEMFSSNTGSKNEIH